MTSESHIKTVGVSADVVHQVSESEQAPGEHRQRSVFDIGHTSPAHSSIRDYAKPMTDAVPTQGLLRTKPALPRSSLFPKAAGVSITPHGIVNDRGPLQHGAGGAIHSWLSVGSNGDYRLVAHPVRLWRRACSCQ